jgi:hypothetical protein
MTAEAGEVALRQQPIVLLSSGESDDIPWFMLGFFLLFGPIFYYSTKARYTGEKKRHEHEQTTNSTIDNLEKKEIFMRSVEKSSTSDIGKGKKYVNSNEVKSKNDMFISELKFKKKSDIW